MPNQRTIRANIVPIGTAPEDPILQTNKLTTKKTKNTIPGYRVAVKRVFLLHFFPPNILYNREEQYPAKEPIRTNVTSIAVINPPRFAGERNPNTAKNIKTTVMAAIWTPVPVNTDKSIGENEGGRKTSPCTSFHPVSSNAS